MGSLLLIVGRGGVRMGGTSNWLCNGRRGVESDRYRPLQRSEGLYQKFFQTTSKRLFLLK